MASKDEAARHDGIDLSHPEFTMRLYNVWSGRITESAVRTLRGTTFGYGPIDMPSVGLYTCMPSDAKCVFSVAYREGQKPRKMKHRLPRRGVFVWSDSRVQQNADKIRKACPEEADAIVRPAEWEHLFDYFDASDLWYFGAWNLWAVIRHLCDENEARKANGFWDPHMPITVDDWVFKWLTHSTNRDKLGGWSRDSDILIVFTDDDWKDIGECRPEVLDLVRCGLVRWFVCYHGGAERQTKIELESEEIADAISGESEAGEDGENETCKQMQFAPNDLDSPGIPVDSTDTGSAFLSLPPGPQRSVSAPSSEAGEIQAPQNDISNPIIGDPPLSDSVEESAEIPQVLVTADDFTREVTIRHPKPSANMAAKSAEQAPQKSSAAEAATMNPKTDAVVQKSNKSGRKAKEPAPQVANTQKQAPKNSEHPQHPQNPQPVHLSAAGSESLDTQPQSIPAHHNAGPSTAVSQQPISHRPQRSKTGSSSTNGSDGQRHHNRQSDRVDIRPRRPSQRENGDVRYMYDIPSLSRNIAPTHRYMSRWKPRHPNCLNSDKIGILGEGTYVACDCSRCTRQSRTVFVRNVGGRESVENKTQELGKILAAFGVVEAITHGGPPPHQRFWVVFENEESTVLAVNALNKKLLGNKGHPLWVTHPFFSKYYVPSERRPGPKRETKMRYPSGDSIQGQRSGSSEGASIAQPTDRPEYGPSPQDIEMHGNQKTQNISQHQSLTLAMGQPPREQSTMMHPRAMASDATASAQPMVSPPAHLAPGQLYPGNGSPVNVVGRMPSDPFVAEKNHDKSRPTPTTAPMPCQHIQNSSLPVPGTFYGHTNQESMAPYAPRALPALRTIGNMESQNQPHVVLYPPSSMAHMPHYHGYPVPVSQPCYPAGAPLAHTAFPGPHIHHMGQHGHPPGHPGAPPMVGPGVHPFNPYVQPEGHRAGVAETYPQFPQDLQHMHLMHPPAPIWVNPAQPPYGPWGMPMPPYQAYPHHPMPGARVPQDMDTVTTRRSPQYRDALQSNPSVAEHLPHGGSSQVGGTAGVKARLPSTCLEPIGRTEGQGIETCHQGGVSISEKGIESIGHKPYSNMEDMCHDAKPSSEEAPVSLNMKMIEHNRQELPPAKDEAAVVGMEAPTEDEECTPAIQSEAPKSNALEEAGISGGNSEDHVACARLDIRELLDLAGDATTGSSVASSQNSLPRELKPTSNPRHVFQDIRLDPDFQKQMEQLSNTVIRHKPNQQSCLPSQWTTPRHIDDYDQPSGHEKYRGSVNSLPEYGAYQAVAGYNMSFVYRGFQSPPVPPPMESSTEIHNFLYGGLSFPPPPPYGYHTEDRDEASRNLNPVFAQQPGAADHSIGKTKAKKKRAKAKKKDVGSRSQTPSIFVEGGFGLTAHSKDPCAQADGFGSATAELGNVKADGIVGTTTAEPKQKGKKNKPKKGSQSSQGSNNHSKVQATPEGADAVVEAQAEREPLSQPAVTSSANGPQTTVQGIEDKMGAIRVAKKERGKGGVSQLEKLFVPEHETVETKAGQIESTTKHERISSHGITLHGSFRGLPTSFNPWPRCPALQSPQKTKSALPRVVVRSPETDNLAPATLADKLNISLHIKRPSGASHRTNESFFTAASRFSSRENTPPSNDDGLTILHGGSEQVAETRLEWHVSPPNTPPKTLPTSFSRARTDTPSTATLSGDLNPPSVITAEKDSALPAEGGIETGPAPSANTGGLQLGPATTPRAVVAVASETAVATINEETADGVKPSKSKKKKNKKKQQLAAQN